MNLDPDDLSMLPVEPKPEEIWDAYQLCRKKLVKANRSRSALRGHDNRRAQLIRDLQRQLQDLENGLRREAETRIRIHELNVRVAEIVKDLEEGMDQVTTISEESGVGGLSEWTVKLARLLPVVLRLRQVKARALRLLGRGVVTVGDLPGETLPGSLPLPEPTPELVPEPTQPPQPDVPEEPVVPSAPVPEARPVSGALLSAGPLVLKDLDYAFGLLLLYSKGSPIPDGFTVAESADWLPSHPLLVPAEPEDELYGPVEAGLLAIREATSPLALLQPWLDLGVLPFALDPGLEQLRLIQLKQVMAATHVLVHQRYASAMEEAGLSTLPLDLDEDLEDLWRGFVLSSTEDKQVLQRLLRPAEPGGPPAPRLSTRGGVRMTHGQGYLATGLGLPQLAVPPTVEVQAVALSLANGQSLAYAPLMVPEAGADRNLWQPLPDVRRLPQLPVGPARLRAERPDGTSLERQIQLTALPEKVQFRRVLTLEHREDWGLKLGPIELPSSSKPQLVPAETSLSWAWQQLNQRDYGVNHLFEQQMLESLSALFQRRNSIPRLDFYQLYAQLRDKPDEWPGFREAVLRAWCEGGWLEEGLERSSGRWRIQPVDPRLVQLDQGQAQLVGLLTARGLMTLLACAHQLQLQVQSVLPACPDLPRGWRFFGDVRNLAAACGLPLVEQSEWIPDPTGIAWTMERPLPSDGATWPTGLRGQRRNDGVCGNRGLDYHWKPRQPFPERGRAPISLKIEAETTTYGKRRWHSFDPVRNQEFTSCHRNRVALHALLVATDGWWPFGFTDQATGQIDRLYDADAYLPLPIGRYAALTGSKMPGPTRLQPQDHTYRYHVNQAFRRLQADTLLLPLTDPP